MAPTVPDTVARPVVAVASREAGAVPVPAAVAVAVLPRSDEEAWAVPRAVPTAVATRAEVAVPLLPARPLALPSASMEVTAASTAAVPVAMLLIRRRRRLTRAPRLYGLR